MEIKNPTIRWFLTPPSEPQQTNIRELHERIENLNNIFARFVAVPFKAIPSIVMAATEIATLPGCGILQGAIEFIDLTPLPQSKGLHTAIKGIGNGIRSMVQIILIVGTVVKGIFIHSKAKDSFLYKLATEKPLPRAPQKPDQKQKVDIEQLERNSKKLEKIIQILSCTSLKEFSEVYPAQDESKTIHRVALYTQNYLEISTLLNTKNKELGSLDFKGDLSKRILEEWKKIKPSKQERKKDKTSSKN